MKRNKFSKDKRRAEIGRRFLTGVALLGLAGVTAFGCSGGGDESSGAVEAKIHDGGADADPDPVSVQISLEGCRSTSIPDGYDLEGNNFVCPDAAYTGGNLFQWNELDLVPHRVTFAAGNSAPDTQDYTVAIAADNIDAGVPGYDVISAPVLNTVLSDPSCALSVGPQVTEDPGTGGTDTSLYRFVTITQDKNTTCVIDYVERLAVGSHDFPGSALHSNLLNHDLGTGGVGAQDVAIPVREIEPQSISKDMTATQDTDYTWNVTKQATPASIDLGNTCDPNNDNQAPVTFRVEWEILPGAPGMVMVVTNIYATNPASRTITVNVTDEIFGNLGAGEVLLNTANSGDVNVPANTTQLVVTNMFDAPDDVSDLNDVATATYIDLVTGIPVPGATVAVASAMIQPGTQTNTTAIITDTESISGNGLQYSLDSLTGVTSSCTVDGVPYALNTPLDTDDFPVICVSVPQGGILDCTDPEGCPVGAADVTKTVYVDPVPASTTGTLSDTATLVASNGFTVSTAPVNISISSNAEVELTLVKTIPDILQDLETITCNFEVKDSSNNVVATPSFEFTAGETQEETTITGLAPDTYTVVEGDSGGLVPSGGTTQMVDLTLPVGSTIADCADTVTFNNIVGAGAALAEVNKVTMPVDFENGWQMTLSGPGTNGGIVLTTADSDPWPSSSSPSGSWKGATRSPRWG